MGSYADKLGYEERWNVIHYIRSLQAVTYEKEYNQYVNTLNAIDRPAGNIVVEVEEEHEGDQHSDEENHNDSH